MIVCFFYPEEGEIPVALNLSDLQVSHDDLAAIVAVLDQVVLVLLRARGAQTVLGAGTDHLHTHTQERKIHILPHLPKTRSAPYSGRFGHIIAESFADEDISFVPKNT